MLRLRHKSVSGICIKDFAKLEALLAQMLSAVFGESLMLRLRVQAKAFEPQNLWVICKIEGGEFAYSVGDAKSTSLAEHFSQIARLAQYSSQHQEYQLRLAPTFREPPQQQFGLDLISLDNKSLKLGQINFAYSGSIEWGNMVTLDQAQAERLSPKTRIHLTSEVPLLKLDQLNISKIKANVNLDCLQIGKNFGGRACRTAERVQIFIEKEGHKMEADAKAVLSISLGEIELELDELMSLRPGTCLEFDAPEILQGMLLLDGAPLAETEIRLKDRFIELKVSELLPRSISDSESGQATFDPNLRLDA